jgi:hypothetical protein
VTCDTRGFWRPKSSTSLLLVNAARGGVPLQFFDMRRVLKKVSLFVFELSPTQSAEHRGLHYCYGNAVSMCYEAEGVGEEG